MRSAYAALAFIAAGTGVFLACSSDATPTASPDGGTKVIGTSSSSGNPNNTDSGTANPNHCDVDAGVVIAPDGCCIHCTEQKMAGKILSVTRPDKPDGVAWANPENGLTEDGAFATVTLEEGQESAFLQTSDFDFSEITDDKETWGIAVELVRQSADAGVEDAIIDVTIAGQQTRSKVLDGTWPRLIVGAHHYGQAIDTWGTDLNPKDVRPPTFGARIAAKHSAGVPGPVFARVDSLRVSVCACNADKK